MKSALQTVKDEYNVSNPEAEIKITVNRLAKLMHTFACESCDQQKLDCCDRIKDKESQLEILLTPLPKHLRNV